MDSNKPVLDIERWSDDELAVALGNLRQLEHNPGFVLFMQYQAQVGSDQLNRLPSIVDERELRWGQGRCQAFDSLFLSYATMVDDLTNEIDRREQMRTAKPEARALNPETGM